MDNHINEERNHERNWEQIYYSDMSDASSRDRHNVIVQYHESNELTLRISTSQLIPQGVNEIEYNSRQSVSTSNTNIKPYMRKRTKHIKPYYSVAPVSPTEEEMRQYEPYEAYLRSFGPARYKM